MGKPGRSRKKQNTGNELKQRILLISALVFCVLIMGLLIRVLVRGGKQSAEPGVEEQRMESAADASPVMETVSTESQIQRLTDQIQADTLQRVLEQYANLGIVKCDSYINFRSAPNQNDLTNIMGELTNGAAVNIVEMDPEGAEGWAHVESGGMDGYMSKRYLVTGEEAVAMVPELIRVRATVITDHLRMRSGPVIEDGNTVGSAAKGEKYEVLERAGQSWIKIAPDNIDTIDTCYMSGNGYYGEKSEIGRACLFDYI